MKVCICRHDSLGENHTHDDIIMILFVAILGRIPSTAATKSEERKKLTQDLLAITSLAIGLLCP